MATAHCRISNLCPTRRWRGRFPCKVPRIGFAVSNTDQANLNSGVTWNDVTANLPFDFQADAGDRESRLDPNPGRDGVAYLSISGFTAATGIGHIFQTTNFGKNWTRMDGAGGPSPLPDVPTLRVLVDNTDTSGKTLLAGTDIGVFRSTDGGATWAAFNLGVIPAVPVFDLEQNKNGLIFAGTHGRGAFELRSPASPTPTPAARPHRPQNRRRPPLQPRRPAPA